MMSLKSITNDDVYSQKGLSGTGIPPNMAKGSGRIRFYPIEDEFGVPKQVLSVKNVDVIAFSRNENDTIED